MQTGRLHLDMTKKQNLYNLIKNMLMINIIKIWIQKQIQ